VNELRDKARFKSTLHEIFEAFKSRSNGSEPPAFIGAAFRDPLEHTTRRFVIDEILAGLGWDLGRMTREIVEEARAQGNTTLFLGRQSGIKSTLVNCGGQGLGQTSGIAVQQWSRTAGPRNTV